MSQIPVGQKSSPPSVLRIPRVRMLSDHSCNLDTFGTIDRSFLPHRLSKSDHHPSELLSAMQSATNLQLSMIQEVVNDKNSISELRKRLDLQEVEEMQVRLKGSDQADKSTWNSMRQGIMMPLAHPQEDDQLRDYGDEFFGKHKWTEHEDEYGFF